MRWRVQQDDLVQFDLGLRAGDLDPQALEGRAVGRDAGELEDECVEAKMFRELQICKQIVNKTKFIK